MKNELKKLIPVFLSMTVLVLSAGKGVAQQKPSPPAPREEVQLGRGMSLIAPSLMELGAKTNFFLQLADRIDLTPGQRKTLEELFFEAQKYGAQREADLDVADAELRRLLTREQIDLASVRAKIKEIEAVRADAGMRRIEMVLKAIKTLTHEQHLKVMVLALEPDAQQPRGQTFQ